MKKLTKKQIDAGVRAYLKSGERFGDGCPACGYGGFWTVSAVDENRAQHERTVKAIVRAIEKAK